MISVVVAAKNEAARIEDCLRHLLASEADEILVVDGESIDDTVCIARLMGVAVIRSTSGSLAADRQLGADLTHGRYVVFIDADHRVRPGDLLRLVRDLRDLHADVVQAQMTIDPHSFWNRAESEFLALTHNHPGERDMVGVAPAVFRRQVLEDVPFTVGIGGGDDTDLMYRLHRDTDYRTAIGTAVVAQEHEPRLRDYVAKWRWYAAGDRAFMAKHPERAASMWFHLLVRYPIVYPARALASGHFRAIPYAVLQGLTRALAALT